MNAKERMYSRIEQHGKNLIAVFGLSEDTDPVKLAKRLHSLEVQANRVMVDYCNGDKDGDEVEDYEHGKLVPALVKIIGGRNIDAVYINRDPRGYTLKLTEEATKEAQDSGIMIYRDWGGYGIIAPEFDGKE